MNFDLPQDLLNFLDELDHFIATQIRPLEAKDDNVRFFDHRREYARTDFENGGLPRHEWEALLDEATALSEAAGYWRFSAPKKFGGRDGSNLWMAVIRDRFTQMGLGLHNDLQNEHSIVGNFPFVAMFEHFGTPEQQEEFILGGFARTRRVAFGLTEPMHGSDATHMETRGTPETRDGVAGWRIDGAKMWISGMHTASHCAVFCRTSGEPGDARGITCLLVPRDTPGMRIDEYLWTFNMPTDHPRMTFENCWVPESAMLGPLGGGLAIAQSFVHQNRIRQAASSLGAATFCLEESLRYARERKTFGHDLARNQAIQFPLVEIATQCEMLRLLIYKTAWEMDRLDHKEVEQQLSDRVSMCNYWANRLVCEAADRAMQVHGGIGYSRHKPFEHIYRHHRRYRITEGSEEIQMRKVAGYLFGYTGPRKKTAQKD
ncbi:acyl-CoA dehydrogenase family protein [Novosphingobium sp. 9U]|uniref:acyl-CoA dehydrogenase family protein n=1 Tax=Novosphingobium sp. 9U TaxID=2653158 RepID=UPI0012EEE2D3|nr:acyl-CoA dehydrogenase family protein [Novosphingobium sp. 9U]VWX50230.1 Acyl-CoA dehydrogenase [Novosphingobium sp. 9U]